MNSYHGRSGLSLHGRSGLSLHGRSIVGRIVRVVGATTATKASSVITNHCWLIFVEREKEKKKISRGKISIQLQTLLHVGKVATSSLVKLAEWNFFLLLDIANKKKYQRYFLQLQNSIFHVLSLDYSFFFSSFCCFWFNFFDFSLFVYYVYIVYRIESRQRIFINSFIDNFFLFVYYAYIVYLIESRQHILRSL